jgi:signal transduction histidine kinase
MLAQLVVAWLPMWALFTTMIVIMHGSSVADAAIGSGRMIAPGAALGIFVYKFATRTQWPHPFRIGFIGLHALAAAVFASVWYAAICTIDAIVTGRFSLSVGPGYSPFLITGVWLYVVVASSAYATIQAQRAAKLEAHAAQMQLHTLRAQLHPHFLFNALHTVVQLIPLDARAAVAAAEQLAAALRTAIEEKRDRISLAEEWAFVQRYLAIERIRFGERLRVVDDLAIATHALSIPSFALQTLVENAVRHAAAPRIDLTTIRIAASLRGAMLELTVSDDGAGVDVRTIENGAGTGLRRLRERLYWLYGERARLDLVSAVGEGFSAVLTIPPSEIDEHE